MAKGQFNLFRSHFSQLSINLSRSTARIVLSSTSKAFHRPNTLISLDGCWKLKRTETRLQKQRREEWALKINWNWLIKVKARKGDELMLTQRKFFFSLIDENCFIGTDITPLPPTAGWQSRLVVEWMEESGSLADNDLPFELMFIFMWRKTKRSLNFLGLHVSGFISPSNFLTFRLQLALPTKLF